MKTLFAILVLLFSFHSSFAQTIKKKRGKVIITGYAGSKQSGKVKNYKKQGVWKYSNGKLDSTITFTDDVRNGLFTTYYADGKKQTEGNYLGGRKSGQWNSWYANGKLSVQNNYSTNNLTNETGDFFDGIQKSWFANGQLLSQTKYENKKLEYRWTWFENGKLRNVEYYKNNLADGTWRTYEDSMKSDTFPTLIQNYSSGKENGLRRAYKNGILIEERNYKNGLLDGTYSIWNDDGSPHISQNYKDGILDGESTFHTVANWVRTENYSNGKKNGAEKLVDDHGKLISLSYYNAGRLDSSRTFFLNGRTASTRVYSYYPGFVRTEVFSVYKEYDDKGNLLLSGKYHFEVKDQDWTTYYPNGKIKSITPHSAGKITGAYKKWYANGKEMIEYQLKNDSVITQPKVWDEKGKLLKPFSKAWQEIVDSSLADEVYNNSNSYRENDGSNNPTIHFVAPRIREERSDVPSSQNEISNVGAVDADDVGLIGDYGDTGEVYQFVQEMPQFPGGNDSMMKFIQRNIVYPVVYKDNGIQGKIFLSFIVEKNGSITNIAEMKGIAGKPDFTKEAMRVISLMPKWSPGKINGNVVRTKMSIPISFVLK